MRAAAQNTTTEHSLIAAAVEPLREQAMSRAEEYARQYVAQIAERLAAAGNDLQVLAPYPSSTRDGRKSFNMKLAFYTAVRRLTTGRGVSRGMHDPEFADMDAAKVARFVEQAREDAASTYDAFVAKLVAKIGPVTSARLQGNSVWQYSVLHVTSAAGEERWKTQQILNVSSLGKVFNQWPTRRMR